MLDPSHYTGNRRKCWRCGTRCPTSSRFREKYGMDAGKPALMTLYPVGFFHWQVCPELQTPEQIEYLIKTYEGNQRAFREVQRQLKKDGEDTSRENIIHIAKKMGIYHDITAMEEEPVKADPATEFKKTADEMLDDTHNENNKHDGIFLTKQQWRAMTQQYEAMAAQLRDIEAMLKIVYSNSHDGREFDDDYPDADE